MGFPVRVLMVTIQWNGMGERAARRHESQQHIHPDDSECETGNGGVGGASVHGLIVLTCRINYAVPYKLSTDGYSRMLHSNEILRRIAPRRSPDKDDISRYAGNNTGTGLSLTGQVTP